MSLARSAFPLFLLLLDLSGSAMAMDCDGKGLTQGDLNLCAGERFEKADKKLNAVYAALSDKLDPPEKEKLKTAQRAWISYRDAQCRFNTMGTEGGSVHSMVYADCLASLTRQQIKILEGQKDCAEGDLSCVH